MLVILDRQHCGQQNRWKSCGAVSPEGIQEIWLTDKYIHHCEWRLRSLGIDVVVISDGRYSERHERANIYAQTDPNTVFIACHINAGGGDYSAAFYDHRSSKGESLARCINDRLNARVEQFQNPRKTREVKAEPDNWTKNALYCIKGVAPVAICWEPFFIDCDNHKSLMTEEGLQVLGQCLADGIKTYFAKQGAIT
jgi:N-acetylmuramoyl-L-alanine amidase